MTLVIKICPRWNNANLPLVLIVIHLKTKHWKYEEVHMVGVMHFYSLGLDTLLLKKIFDNFQFQYIYGQKVLKSYP
jgi:hypothetical protein